MLRCGLSPRLAALVAALALCALASAATVTEVQRVAPRREPHELVHVGPSAFFFVGFFRVFALSPSRPCFCLRGDRAPLCVVLR